MGQWYMENNKDYKIEDYTKYSIEELVEAINNKKEWVEPLAKLIEKAEKIKERQEDRVFINSTKDAADFVRVYKNVRPDKEKVNDIVGIYLNAQNKVLQVKHIDGNLLKKTDGKEKFLKEAIVPDSCRALFLKNYNIDKNVDKIFKSTKEIIKYSAVDVADMIKLNVNKDSIYYLSEFSNQTMPQALRLVNGLKLGQRIYKDDTTFNAFTTQELETIKDYHFNKIIGKQVAENLSFKWEELTSDKKTPLKETKEVLWHIKEATKHLPHEESYIIAMNKEGVIKKVERVGHGTTAISAIDLGTVSKNLLDDNYARFIHMHNHPSNNLTASDPDKQITEHIYKLADALNKKVNFIITSKDGLQDIERSRPIGYNIDRVRNKKPKLIIKKTESRSQRLQR